MRKNAKNSRRSRNGDSGGGRAHLRDSITRVPFHRASVATLSGVTGLSVLTISPQSTGLGALAEIGDEFDLFRCVDLEYRLHPMDPTNDLQVAAYVPDIDTQTVTAIQLSESTLACVQSQYSGVPSAWMKVPRSQLKGMLDWYKCQPDAGAAEFESQGQLIFAGGLSETYITEVRGMMEFKNPVSDVLMMDRTIRRAAAEGKVVILPPKPTETPAEKAALPNPTRR